MTSISLCRVFSTHPGRYRAHLIAACSLLMTGLLPAQDVPGEPGETPPAAFEQTFETRLPYGLGMGLGYTRQSMPVTDFRMGLGTTALDETSIELTGNRSEDTLLMTRLDFQIGRFFNLYGLLGYTSGNSDVTLVTPEVNVDIPIDFTINPGPGPGLPINFVIPIRVPSYSLALDQDHYGPTWGGGLTLGGDWRWAFGSLDANYVRADYDSSLGLVQGDMEAYTVTPRVGGRWQVPDKNWVFTLWTGAMFMEARKSFDGKIPIAELDPNLAAVLGDFVAYQVETETEDPWNYLVGIHWALGPHWGMNLEAGFGDREQILAGITTRF